MAIDLTNPHRYDAFIKEFEDKYGRTITLGDRWALEDRQRKEKEARMAEDARLDAKAVWHVANYHIPADVKEMAERWKMQEFIEEMWRQAFISGWREALRK